MTIVTAFKSWLSSTAIAQNACNFSVMYCLTSEEKDFLRSTISSRDASSAEIDKWEANFKSLVKSLVSRTMEKLYEFEAKLPPIVQEKNKLRRSKKKAHEYSSTVQSVAKRVGTLESHKLVHIPKPSAL